MPEQGAALGSIVITLAEVRFIAPSQMNRHGRYK